MRISAKAGREQGESAGKSFGVGEKVVASGSEGFGRWGFEAARGGASGVVPGAGVVPGTIAFLEAEAGFAEGGFGALEEGPFVGPGLEVGGCTGGLGESAEALQ